MTEGVEAGLSKTFLDIPDVFIHFKHIEGDSFDGFAKGGGKRESLYRCH